jgi:hypothetical protein
MLGLSGCVHLPIGVIPAQEATLPVALASLTGGADEDLAAWTVLVRAGWRLDPTDLPGTSWVAADLLAQAVPPVTEGEQGWRVVSTPELLTVRLVCPADAAEACARFLGATLATPRWRPEALAEQAQVAVAAQRAALEPSAVRTRPWVEGLVLEGRAGATSGVDAVARGDVPTAAALDAWWRTTAVRRAVWVGRTPAAAAADTVLLEALAPLSTAMPPDRPAARAPRAAGREGIWVFHEGPTSVGLGGVLPAPAAQPRAMVVEAWISGAEALLPGVHAGRTGEAAWWVQGDADDLSTAWARAEARRTTPAGGEALTQPCGAEEAAFASAWSWLTADADVCRVRPVGLTPTEGEAWWREAVDAWSAVVVVGPHDPRGLVGR